MPLFSRCDASQCFEPSMRSTSPRRVRTPSEMGAMQTLSGFFEDVGILARYALGLDYYGRDRGGEARR